MSIYLIISLFFVVTTFVEFAIVLFLNRKVERLSNKSKISAPNYEVDYLNQIYQTPTKEGEIESKKKALNPETTSNFRNANLNTRSFYKVKNGLCINTSLSTRIDMIVFWIFTFGYVIFNIIYWNIYTWNQGWSEYFKMIRKV